MALQLGRSAEAENAAREAAEVARSSWQSELSGCVVLLAETLAWLNDPAAESALADAQQLIDERRKEAGRPQLLRARGLWLMHRGAGNSAVAELEASAALARSQHSSIQLGRTLAVLADAARLHGETDLAARSETERAAVVAQIGPEVRGLVWARGLRGPRRRRAERSPADDHMSAGLLSPRERQVAALIAHGLTDHQIGERLIITEGTAGVHVGHILNKLGFHTRAEIASWVVRHELGQEDAL
jgi:DNA-binding CsgD family transcriptional regulator